MDKVFLKNKLVSISNTLLDAVGFNNGGCGRFALAIMDILDSAKEKYTVVLYRPIIVMPNSLSINYYDYITSIIDVSDIKKMTTDECITFEHVDIIYDDFYINDRVRLRNQKIAMFSKTYCNSETVYINNNDPDFKLFKKLLKFSITHKNNQNIWNPKFKRIFKQNYIKNLIDQAFNDEQKVA